MNAGKRRRLEAKGWKVGSAREFLGLSEAEVVFIEVKARLSRQFLLLRKKRALSQSQVAKRIGSSQSRVAKMEANDASVSLDLLVRALVILGATPRAIGNAFAAVD